MSWAFRRYMVSHVSRCLCPNSRVCTLVAAGGQSRVGITHSPSHKLGNRLQVRTAKRKSSINVQAVSQISLLEAPVEPIDPDDGPVYSAMLQQHLNNMRKFPDCVLLSKVGSFYEMYFEQAEKYAALLNIKLAKRRNARSKEGFVYMAGFPLHQMDRYLQILVNELGMHVAIADQKRFGDESAKINAGGNEFDREVYRIITPGTLIDETFMDPLENNFLLSIYAGDGSGADQVQDVGLAWVDLSSGDFFVQRTDVSILASAIARIGPREVLVDESFESMKDSALMSIVRQGHYSISFASLSKAHDSASHWSLEQLSPGLKGREFSDAEISAGSLLLSYVNSTQLGQPSVELQPPIQRRADEYMLIDKHSLRALEVTETLRDGYFEGSLLHAVRRTTTQSGARLLTQRLKAPCVSLGEVNERLDIVQELLQYPALREEIIIHLKGSFDSLRLVSKFAFGRGEADDLLRLSQTIHQTAKVADRLEEHLRETPRDSSDIRSRLFRNLLGRFCLREPQRLADKITDAIDEDQLEELQRLQEQDEAEMLALADNAAERAGEDKIRGGAKLRKIASTPKQAKISTDMWIMRRTASPTLSRLHDELDALFTERDNLEAEWRDLIGTKKLSLKFMQPHGHVLYLSGAKDIKLDLSPLGRLSLAKAGNTTRSYWHPAWTALGSKIERIKDRARSEESRVLDMLSQRVVKNMVELRKNAAVLDELDVASGFATLAAEKNWSRPLLTNSTTLHIRQGRHPTVESGLLAQGKHFTPNDCRIGSPSRIHLITGPNMGGKSTFLRQNALLAILAQTGSYVPAEYAEIGIVDKLFSRVGSADNLYAEQSTFMVEMMETAQILAQATPRSFVIMDEVGRGTTPEDGVAVGFAALWHLYQVNGCRALFATHFHALADMTREFPGLECWCTDVLEEEGGGFAFVHKLRRGVSRESHALKVARLAGMPDEAIAVASKVLEQFKTYNKPAYVGTPGAIGHPQKLVSAG